MNLMLLSVRTAGLTLITVGRESGVAGSAPSVVGSGTATGEAGLSVSVVSSGLTPIAPKFAGGEASVWEHASDVIFRMVISV